MSRQFNFFFLKIMLRFSLMCRVFIIEFMDNMENSVDYRARGKENPVTKRGEL